MLFTKMRYQQLIGIAMLMIATTSFAQTAHNSIDDNDILEAVESDLRFDDAITPDGVDVQVRDGVVTLSGSAHTLFAKRRAVQLVGSLKGVRAIVDAVKVLPSGMSDEQIFAVVQAALDDDPVADEEEIQVIVSLGLVTLKGSVDSFPEKRLTEVAVAGVRGVTEIDNQLTILTKKTRPDEEINSEIQRRFELSPYLVDGLLDVQVHSGVATLTGAVGSVDEKGIASLLCWVAGVKQVDDSKLEVKWWLDRDQRRDKFSVLRNDVQLQHAVQDTFLYDPRLRGGKIEVRVRLANVSLLGSVASLHAKRAAEEDAKNTLGVRRVMNYLKVKQAKWPGDPAVTKLATAALQRDAHLAHFDLLAKSHFGKVYLSGDVNRNFGKNRAEVVVANVPGALEVVNRISVDSPWQAKSDEDIKEDTLRRLGWSPLLDADQINVTVDDGVVTLSGQVYTPQERDAAAKHARQGGARRVVDRLTVPVGLKATLIPKQ